MWCLWRGVTWVEDQGRAGWELTVSEGGDGLQGGVGGNTRDLPLETGVFRGQVGQHVHTVAVPSLVAPGRPSLMQMRRESRGTEGGSKDLVSS